MVKICHRYPNPLLEVYEYRDVFAAKTEQLGRTNVTQHKIVLEKDSMTFMACPYRANPDQRKETE